MSYPVLSTFHQLLINTVNKKNSTIDVDLSEIVLRRSCEKKLVGECSEPVFESKNS